MHAPRFVFEEMGDYEVSLAELQRLYKQLRAAAPEERPAAQRDYERALQRARDLGARVARDLDAAHAHRGGAHAA